jgi:hypothetical protein
MGYYYVINGVDSAQPDNIDSRTPSVLYNERILQLNAQGVVQRSSNFGSDNPYKGPSPRTLFYDAGFRQPGKYGQFLMYAFGNGENDFMEAYYKSENSNYNTKVSSIESKNPSAAFLVNTSAALEASSLSNTLNSYLSPSLGGSIVGGLSAPYNWKDFLYCKYYGTIPNNYMLTLRRFPTPMRDNMSLPDSVKNSDQYRREGAGRPVAQAVTWFGGDTGNKLSEILKFTTGIKWESKTQENSITQEAFDKGIFESLPFNLVDIAQLLSDRAPEDAAAAQEVISLLALVQDPNSTVERQNLAYALRDKAVTNGGPLSEFIWNTVDVVDKTYYRGLGLTFSDNPITLKFTYDLTSVGEVNTKAAMLDLLGSLLAIGTNYGRFLTPNIRYDNGFPAIGFPGGDAGLAEFYRDPANWFSKYWDKFQAGQSKAKPADPQTIGGTNQTTGTGTTSNTAAADDYSRASPAIQRAADIAIQKSFLEKVQLPLSFLTGAPIGEWHLVVGNPCNPIAMIGNLICETVDIDFSDKLGPDDFPTEITATFTLKHGRSRERGEIESMFNRGDGRLYQSNIKTFANGQSTGAFADTQGNVITEDLAQKTTSGANTFTQSEADSQAPPAAQ